VINIKVINNIRYYKDGSRSLTIDEEVKFEESLKTAKFVNGDIVNEWKAGQIFATTRMDGNGKLVNKAGCRGCRNVNDSVLQSLSSMSN
jgi:hypothetical protein